MQRINNIELKYYQRLIEFVQSMDSTILQILVHL